MGSHEATSRDFATYLDTVPLDLVRHLRGSRSSSDLEGKKLASVTSGKEQRRTTRSAKELRETLERRRIRSSPSGSSAVTDGGRGIIKALKDRYGKKHIHQRCTLH